ncbi:hypothetical protein ABEF95_000566 [Exophiala dermatitidis]
METTSAPGTAIFSPVDEEDLVRSGLLTPSVEGKRKVHKRRLDRSSDETNSHVPLTPTSLSPSPEVETDLFSTIPDSLISLATLQYLGYDENTAKKIWQSWINWSPGPIVREIDDDLPGTMSVSFIDYAKGFVGGDTDTYDEEDQPWFECMNSWGILPSVQEAIMDPVFKNIRLSETCRFWVRDTMEIRYGGLEEIQKASRERAMGLQRAALRPGNTSQIVAGASQGASGSGSRSFSASQRTQPGISPHTAMSAEAIASMNAPIYTVLFKGISKTRLQGLLDEDGNLSDITALLSPPPTDFLGRESGYYFTVEREVAVRYASYAKRRDGNGSNVILSVKLPNAAVESLPEGQLQKTYFPSEDWQRLIFQSRRRQRLP